MRSNYNGAKKFEELPLGERSKSFIYALDQNNNPYTPAWYTIDFRGTFSFNDNMSINFAVENVLDKRYKPYSSGIAAPGRNFLFSFNLEF